MEMRRSRVYRDRKYRRSARRRNAKRDTVNKVDSTNRKNAIATFPISLPKLLFIVSVIHLLHLASRAPGRRTVVAVRHSAGLGNLPLSSVGRDCGGFRNGGSEWERTSGRKKKRGGSARRRGVRDSRLRGNERGGEEGRIGRRRKGDRERLGEEGCGRHYPSFDPT
jgi:hypothetical protein